MTDSKQDAESHTDPGPPGVVEKSAICDRMTLGQTIVLGLIRTYQLVLSPWIGRQCRFYPTCSHYGMEAIQVHGVWRGLRLTINRLLKCHPFHEGGVDLVPHSKPQPPR